MMRTLFLAPLLLTAGAALAPAAIAQDSDWNGPYLGIGGGYSFKSDDEIVVFDTDRDGDFDDTVRTSGGANAARMKDVHSIYLDAQSTTPLDPRVLDAMMPWLTTLYGNPHSRTHDWGIEAEDAVEAARADVAALIGASDELERITHPNVTKEAKQAVSAVRFTVYDELPEERN